MSTLVSGFEKLAVGLFYVLAVTVFGAFIIGSLGILYSLGRAASYGAYEVIVVDIIPSLTLLHLGIVLLCFTTGIASIALIALAQDYFEEEENENR